MPDLRAEIDGLIAARSYQQASARLRELWSHEATASVAGFVVSRFEQLRGHIPLIQHRVSIQRSFTVEPIVPLLRAAAFCAGIDLCVHVGDFNAYSQQILDAESALYRFDSQTVILAAQTSEVVPELWLGYGEAAIARTVRHFEDLVRAFREHSQANLVIHLLEVPATPARGIFDSQSANSQMLAIQQINGRIRGLAFQYRGVYVLDYDQLVARHGRLQWRDERKWLSVRLPISASNLVHMAREWMRFIQPLAGRVAKAVAVDLDNTLWGGVIGEDGFDGIVLGPEYPGAAYQALQRALLDLRQRGILLAVCSKNDPATALEALEKHPGMLLRPHHFTTLKLNWQDKTQNLREIASEIGIGTDALAFIDDNPVECQNVRASMPEVTVVELPGDPLRYAEAVRGEPAFERLTILDEDRARNEYYAAERGRVELGKRVTSPEDFYRALRQQVEILPATPATIPRIAQLTQKTNQFNLTTKRYTEQQIADFAAQSGCAVFSMRVRDRYADNGLVGVALLRCDGDACEIDTLLLSCRVIGRTVETAFLALLADWARGAGARSVRGWFHPTAKNTPAANFYSSHGFHQVRSKDNGSLWELDLSASTIAVPDWIDVAPQSTAAILEVA